MLGHHYLAAGEGERSRLPTLGWVLAAWSHGDLWSWSGFDYHFAFYCVRKTQVLFV